MKNKRKESFKEKRRIKKRDKDLRKNSWEVMFI
jgi:hypothetical protein